MAAASSTIPVIRASRTALIRLARNCGRSGERVPTQHPGSRRHLLRKPGTPKGRHGVLARTRALEDVAALVNRTVDISGLARDADFALHAVVVRFELLITEWPIFH